MRSNPPAAGNSKDGWAEGQNEHLDHEQLEMQAEGSYKVDGLLLGMFPLIPTVLCRDDYRGVL